MASLEEKRTINNLGYVNIPKKMRNELGLFDKVNRIKLTVRESPYGEKEILLQRLDTYEDMVKVYTMWARVIARVTSGTVAIVWNNKILLMTGLDNTMDFSDKKVYVSMIFRKALAGIDEDYAVFRDKVPFLNTGDGVVKAVFRIKRDWGAGYFAVVHGTKYDLKEDLTEEESLRRYAIVRDIVNKIM